MSFSVEQAFVGRDEIRALLKTPAWEAMKVWDVEHAQQSPTASESRGQRLSAFIRTL